METILEVQTIAPNAQRSWFLGDEEVVEGVLHTFSSTLRLSSLNILHRWKISAFDAHRPGLSSHTDI